jgi:hypothetical protein
VADNGPAGDLGVVGIGHQAAQIDLSSTVESAVVKASDLSALQVTAITGAIALGNHPQAIALLLSASGLGIAQSAVLPYYEESGSGGSLEWTFWHSLDVADAILVAANAMPLGGVLLVEAGRRVPGDRIGGPGGHRGRRVRGQRRDPPGRPRRAAAPPRP